MKNIIRSLIFLCIFILNACNLTEKPYGFYSESNFYKTVDDAESALLYAYGAMTYIEYSRSIFFLGDMPTEEMTTKSDASAENRNLDEWNITNFNTNATLERFFQYSYIGINRANAVIKNVPNGEFGQTYKDQFLGEAYFLRAYYYFSLTKNFGLVPLHKSVVETLEQTNSPLAKDMDEVYDFIISDCETSINYLKNTVHSTPKIGRVDRVAAEALLSKVYLYIASAKEHNVLLYRDMNKDIDEMYSKAAYFANEVITKQSTYGFEDNLIDLYDVENARGKEKIFIMGMDRTGIEEGEYSKISKMFIPYIAGAKVYIKQGDNDEYIPTHDGWEEYQTEIDFYNSFAPTDKRKTHLIVDKVYNENKEIIASWPDNGLKYPFSRKYIDPRFIADKTSTRPYLIRYSDIALVYAEAAGPTKESYNLVNYIRERAGLEPLPSNLNKNDFRKRIYEERKYEMAFEGDRMYDIRRWNLISEIQEASNLTEEESTFYPIPQTEIDLNNSIIK